TKLVIFEHLPMGVHQRPAARSHCGAVCDFESQVSASSASATHVPIVVPLVCTHPRPVSQTTSLSQTAPFPPSALQMFDALPQGSVGPQPPVAPHGSPTFGSGAQVPHNDPFGIAQCVLWHCEANAQAAPLAIAPGFAAHAGRGVLDKNCAHVAAVIASPHA